MTSHHPLDITARTTRAEIQHEITTIRGIQRRNPYFARDYDHQLSELLDALLEREPEPA